MRRPIIILTWLAVSFVSSAQEPRHCSVRTVAGLTTAYGGDGGPATAAQLSFPSGLALDKEGNLYLADSGNRRIRRVTEDGLIDTITGPGVGVADLAVDRTGSLFFTGENRVRKVDLQGTLITIAGRGSRGFSGDGGDALLAELDSPAGLTVDPEGNIFVADSGNNRVRKITTDGRIQTVAGSGPSGNVFRFGGDGGPATAARLSRPRDVALDAEGNLFVSDSNNRRIRLVSRDGLIRTLADMGPSRSALVPNQLVLDNSGNLYVTDSGNRVLKLTKDGGISVLAGAAFIRSPSGLAIDEAGCVYVSESGNDRIRKICSDGTATTVAGIGIAAFSGDDGPATAAHLDSPGGIAVDRKGNLYVADSGNQRVRRVTPDGIISTVAGRGGLGIGTTDIGDGGPAVAALLYDPAAVASDNEGSFYIAESSGQRIRMVNPDNVISTIASVESGPAPGGFRSLYSNFFEAIAIDDAGNVFFADSRSGVVHKRAADGSVGTVAGSRFPSYRGEDAENQTATAVGLVAPRALAPDPAGFLYIMEWNTIRRVTPEGRIQSVPSTAGVITGPTGMALDRDGTLFLATGLAKVYRVTERGNWITLADGLREDAVEPPFFSPNALALDRAGNLFITDLNHRVRLIEAARDCIGEAAPVVGAVRNAASWREQCGITSSSTTSCPAPLAPGQIVSIRGVNLGPRETESWKPTAEGLVGTVLADIRIFFDGVPAPMLSVQANEIQAVVPYQVAGQDLAIIEVEYQGTRVCCHSASVRPSAPGIFSADASGRGQALAWNENGESNSPSRPARRGSVLRFRATGEGQTDPAGVDGMLAGQNPPRPRLPVMVRIGGQEAAVLSSGGVPGMVAGLLEVTVRVPDLPQAGSGVPLELIVGEARSQSGVTIAVE